MQLEDFIRETLVQLVSGTSSANDAVKQQGAVVCPNFLAADGHLIYNDGRRLPYVSKVEFDIAVTTTDEKGKTGGIGVAIASIGVGTKSTQEKSTSSVSRIKFEVPILYPRNQIPKSG